MRRPSWRLTARRVFARRASRIGAIAALCVTAMVAAACTASTSTSASSGSKAITIAYANDLESWSPYATLNNLTFSRWSNVYETLVSYANGDFQPVLATSWSVAGDVWTFHLRQNVKFQDGSPFTSADVVNSLNRATHDKTSLQSTHMARIASADAVDPSTVKITTKTPDAVLLSDLTSLFITSKATYDKYGPATADEHPNGTGPYSFLSWQKGVSFSVKKDNTYWGKEPADMPTQMTFRVIPNPVDAVAALQSGEVDIVTNVPFQDIETLSKGGDTHVVTVPGIRTMFYGFQVTIPPFNNPLVREAITSAIDVPGITKNVLQGELTPMNGPIPASIFGADSDSTNPYPYDPAKAKQLLAQAGAVGDAITLTTTSGTTPADTEVSQAVQQELEAIGLKVTIKTPDFATQGADLEAGKLGFYLGNRGNYFDANVFLSQYFQGGVSKRTGYSNPTVNQLLTEQAAELDKTKRLQLLHQAEELLMKDAPAVFFGAYKDIYGITNRVSWTPTVDQFIRGVNISVK
jgi:peptide/nickel transport system substrate-binding protein